MIVDTNHMIRLLKNFLCTRKICYRYHFTMKEAITFEIERYYRLKVFNIPTLTLNVSLLYYCYCHYYLDTETL